MLPKFSNSGDIFLPLILILLDYPHKKKNVKKVNVILKRRGGRGVCSCPQHRFQYENEIFQQNHSQCVCIKPRMRS